MSETFLPFAYLQSQFVPFAEANISIATHALHYGTAAFAGMRGIPNPQNPNEILLFRLDRHTQRLSEGARFLHYDLPASKIEAIIVDFVKKNTPEAPFYIRPLVYTSGLGLVPRLHNVEKDIFVYGLLLGDYLKGEGVSCRFSSWVRQADQSFPLRGKITGAYITSSLAKTEAVDSGFDEALLVNAQGKVSEASGMNVFMVRQGRLVTPGFDQDILEGITRDSVITLAKDMGLEVVERPIDKSELLIASEVFLTGTAAKITPIRQIENYHLPSERPITEALRVKLTAITEGRDLDHADWVYRIPLR
jgi:branched-chain amino acid aminotransferase